MRLATNSFRGELPRLTPRALPDDASQDATNARLLTGDVTAWNQLAITKLLDRDGPVQSIALMAEQYWLSFDSDVDIARGIIPGDDTYRTYLTGLDVPRFTNLAMATSGEEPYPTTTRPLGVPAPEAAPTVAAGVDPNPTTFAIDILDEGDSLATDWTVAPSQFAHGGATQVTQSGAVGNPAPSYELLFDDNPGAPAYAYRNFGVANCSALHMSWDFMCTSGSNNYLQMVAGVLRTSAGAGIQISIVSGSLIIGIATAWNTPGSSAIATTAISGPSFDVWYTCTVDVVINVDSTQTVTATLYLGSAQVGTVTASTSFGVGDYCGFVAETSNNDGVDRYRTYYDNILVQGSGATGYNPQSTATSYVYTFVNDLGEESAPSFASATVLRPDGIAITVTTPTGTPSGVSSEYGITTKRIYRAATGSTGTLFRFVAEVPLAQAEYVDSIPDTELGEALESEGWDLPPDDLRGILALPNGVMVGFRRNQLCFSAQNRPHAWPVAYRLNTDTDIVGIGNIDTTVVMGTESFIYLAGGNDPSAYSMSKLEVPQACVSKRSFAYLTGIGVVFATPDGLVAVAGTGQVRNLTETVFTRDQWQALSPETILGVAHDDVYHFFYDNGVSAGRGGFMLDMKSSGFGLAPVAYHACAAYADPLSDNLYLVLDDNNEPTDDLLPLPSTAPAVTGVLDPDFDSNALLLHFDGDNGSTTFTDVMGHTVSLEGTGAALSTAQKKFGSASLSGCTNTTFARCGGSQITSLLSSYTLEGWVYLPESDPGTAFNILRIPTTAGDVSVGFYAESSPPNRYWITRARDSGYVADGPYLYAAFPGRGEWTHIAACSDGALLYLFIGGELIGTQAIASGALAIGSAIDIGNASGGVLTGVYFDDVRFTNGAARYTEAFTPPTRAFPDEGSYDTYAGNVVFQFNGDDTSNMVYRWRSKLYVLGKPTSFMKVQVKAARFVNTVLKFYKQVLTNGTWDDVLVRELVVESEDPIALAVDTDYTRCWWEVLSTDPIQGVQVAEDISELD